MVFRGEKRDLAEMMRKRHFYTGYGNSLKRPPLFSPSSQSTVMSLCRQLSVKLRCVFHAAHRETRTASHFSLFDPVQALQKGHLVVTFEVTPTKTPMASKTASKSSKKAQKPNGEAKKRKKPCRKFSRDDILRAAQEIWDARVQASARTKRVTAPNVLDYIGIRGKGPRNSAKTPSLRHIQLVLKDFHPVKLRPIPRQHVIDMRYLGRRQQWG